MPPRAALPAPLLRPLPPRYPPIFPPASLALPLRPYSTKRKNKPQSRPPRAPSQPDPAPAPIPPPLTGPLSASAIAAARHAASRVPDTNIIIPPHATSYLPLPTPPQSDEAPPQRARGYLPRPRDPFPKHEGNRKVKSAYFAATVPAPTTARGKRLAEPGTKRRFRQAVAATRREALRSSLQRLWRRKHDLAWTHKTLSDRRIERNAAQINRTRMRIMHDALTRPTIPAAVLDTGVKPDPDRGQRAQSRRAKRRNLDRARKEMRRAAILELYHNATKFIVDERDLREEVERVFADGYFEKWGNGESAWEVWGPPPGMADIMAGTMGDMHMTEVDRNRVKGANRLRVVGEQMTGGKLLN